MPKPMTYYSRFNARYLASRYAGTTFMFLALGLLSGLVYRLLFQPVLYTSRTDVAVTVIPDDAIYSFNWNAKADEWKQLLHEQRDLGLLNTNLRYVLKLAVTPKEEIPDADLSLTLAEFNTGVPYSTSFFRNRYLQRFFPEITVDQSDIARFLDFQSLAAIIADTLPPDNQKQWDFSFFKETLLQEVDSGVIVDPDEDDLFFRVFYKLHEYLNNRPALTPHAAWRSAVDELTARIERESSSPGEGGFGPVARQELVREIQSIPVIAANGLYHANSLFRGEGRSLGSSPAWNDNWTRNAFVTLIQHGRGNGLATANVSLQLSPLGFPRDIPQTHIGPLAVATLLNFVAARERQGIHHSSIVETAPIVENTQSTAQDNIADFVAELEGLPVPETVAVELPSGESVSDEHTNRNSEPVTTSSHTALPSLEELPPLELYEDPSDPEPANIIYVEMYDEVAAKQQQSLVRMHEEAVKLANVEREAVLRQLYTARAASNRLSHEAITARNRADKLRERYDLMAASEGALQPNVSQQTHELFQKRDELLQRLISLREYCTEEHPFVKLALRDLRSVEQMLGNQSPDASANRDAEARATRLANLYLEWETAISQADVFEERARQHDETIACLLDEITNLERCISQREIELAQAREAQVPIIRVPAPQQPVLLPPAPTPEPEPSVLVAQEVPETPPATTASPGAAQKPVMPKLLFSDISPAIGTTKRLPDWNALLWGVLGGLLTAFVWMLLREIFADRFRNVGEAHRLTGLPVLASLPAYDQVSVQNAADTMKGDILRTRPGRHQFMPLLVEASEPAPEGRRGKISPARKKSRWGAWVLGLVLLAISGFLLYRATTGYIFPLPRGTTRMNLALPAETVPIWAEDNATHTRETWGSQP